MVGRAVKRICVVSVVLATVGSGGATGASTVGGTKLWVARYNGPSNSADEVGAIAVSPDGEQVFVTGRDVGSPGYLAIATLSYDTSTGLVRWLQRFNAPGEGTDQGTDVAVSPDGSMVFVTGQSEDVRSSSAIVTLAYSASSGSPIWLRLYRGPERRDNYPSSMAVSPDGSTVFVAGHSAGADGDWDFVTLAYDASTGSPSWGRRYDGPYHGSDYASAIAVSADGSTVFVTGGTTGSANGVDYATVAYEASTGVIRWSRRFDGPHHLDDVPD